MGKPSQRIRPTSDMLETPEGYREWTAHQKHEWLWSSLLNTTAHERTALPELALPFKTNLFKELAVVTRRAELVKALDRDDDLMEQGRPKVIHARGSVAMIKLIIDGHSPYTGLLSPGAAGGASGLIRMSLVAKVVGKTAYTPALALKLLIDGRSSADLLAMNHTVGQGRDFSLFSNTMTNDLTDEHKELRSAQKVMAVMFHRVSRQPRRLVTSHLVNQLSDGTEVPETVVPKRLVFHPTSAAKEKFNGKAGVDFRLVMANFEPGITLFEVEGINYKGENSPVGVIKTTTGFVSSDGGDRLFFRHVQDRADRKI